MTYVESKGLSKNASILQGATSRYFKEFIPG